MAIGARALSLVARPADGLLAARMLAWRVALPVLKRALPLPRLIGLVRPRRTAAARSDADEQRIARLASGVTAVGGAPDRGNCLTRSLIMYRYLVSAAAEPQLVIGVRRDEGSVLSHAWVVVDDHPQVETAASLAGYEPLLIFDSAGALEPRTG